jgi:hypothetical protein
MFVSQACGQHKLKCVSEGVKVASEGVRGRPESPRNGAWYTLSVSTWLRAYRKPNAQGSVHALFPYADLIALLARLRGGEPKRGTPKKLRKKRNDISPLSFAPSRSPTPYLPFVVLFLKVRRSAPMPIRASALCGRLSLALRWR